MKNVKGKRENEKRKTKMEKQAGAELCQAQCSLG